MVLQGSLRRCEAATATVLGVPPPTLAGVLSLAYCSTIALALNEVDVCAGADTIPREMYVHLLKNSPHARGILSSKAVGEPPLLLACSALSAVQV